MRFKSSDCVLQQVVHSYCFEIADMHRQKDVERSSIYIVQYCEVLLPQAHVKENYVPWLGISGIDFKPALISVT
jgi:hypothetical protein